jgi:hypothetical protein
MKSIFLNFFLVLSFVSCGKDNDRNINSNGKSPAPAQDFIFPESTPLANDIINNLTFSDIEIGQTLRYSKYRQTFRNSDNKKCEVDFTNLELSVVNKDEGFFEVAHRYDQKTMVANEKNEIPEVECFALVKNRFYNFEKYKTSIHDYIKRYFQKSVFKPCTEYNIVKNGDVTCEISAKFEILNQSRIKIFTKLRILESLRS